MMLFLRRALATPGGWRGGWCAANARRRLGPRRRRGPRFSCANGSLVAPLRSQSIPSDTIVPHARVSPGEPVRIRVPSPMAGPTRTCAAGRDSHGLGGEADGPPGPAVRSVQPPPSRDEPTSGAVGSAQVIQVSYQWFVRAPALRMEQPGEPPPPAPYPTSAWPSRADPHLGCPVQTAPSPVQKRGSIQSLRALSSVNCVRLIGA